MKETLYRASGGIGSSKDQVTPLEVRSTIHYLPLPIKKGIQEQQTSNREDKESLVNGSPEHQWIRQCRRQGIIGREHHLNTSNIASEERSSVSKIPLIRTVVSEHWKS